MLLFSSTKANLSLLFTHWFKYIHRLIDKAHEEIRTISSWKKQGEIERKRAREDREIYKYRSSRESERKEST